jgi:hypothetical protein
MDLTIEETLVGALVILFLITLVVITNIGQWINFEGIMVWTIIILVLAGVIILFNGKSTTIRSLEKTKLILDGQTQDIATTSNKKSVDGKQVSFQEKTITTESRMAN